MDILRSVSTFEVQAYEWLWKPFIPLGEVTLLLGGDTISKLTREEDPASAPLFGDAGFAVVLERNAAAAPIHYAFMTDGSGASAIKAEHGGRLSMDGMDVFNFAIKVGGKEKKTTTTRGDLSLRLRA